MVTSLYIWSLFTGKLEIKLYILSLCLMGLITKVSLNMLMLDGHTNTLPFIVEHPIPLKMKLYHLQTELMNFVMSSSPDILSNRIRLSTFHEVLENHINLESIKGFNAKEIHEYTTKIFNEYNREMHDKQVSNIRSIHLIAIALIAAAVSIH